MTDVVVGAAIIRSGRVLAQQRGYPPAAAGRWELPGGRVEPGEDDRAALARECLEELGIAVDVGARVGPEITLRPGLVLRIYQAVLTGGTPHPHDHQALHWVGESEVDSVDWLPADRAVVPWLRAVLRSAPD
jgi:8-oxo-dGTP diphosphatase